jgi:hypothetical protein
MASEPGFFKRIFYDPGGNVSWGRFGSFICILGALGCVAAFVIFRNDPKVKEMLELIKHGITVLCTTAVTLFGTSKGTDLAATKVLANSPEMSPMTPPITSLPSKDE